MKPDYADRMRVLISGIIAFAAAAMVVLIVAGDTTAGKGIALALFGIACVVAVSAVFFAVGRSEDEERRAAEAARKPPPPPAGDRNGEPGADPHPRPALDRRRPMPPRRPR
jgi:hypothetical protein